VIGLEKASQVGGPWQAVPANQLSITSDGKLVDSSTSSAGYYRLNIETQDGAGAPVGLPLASLPKEIVSLAQGHLDSLYVEEAEWQGAVLGPVVVPVYHPAVDRGKAPAFYEFKVVAPRSQSTSPNDPRPDRGYIVVSSGPHFFPVGDYATEGPTPSERLRFLARSTAVHILRYSATFWVAENEQGQVVASLGPMPYRIPEGVLKYIGQEHESRVEGGQMTQQGMRPGLGGEPYGSYGDFKKDVVSGPVHTVLRQFTARRALVDWNLYHDKTPEILSVPLKRTVTVLDNELIASADLEEPIANIAPAGVKGLTVTGLEQGAAILMVISPTRECQFYVLAVGSFGGSFDPMGWSSWSESYGGRCADIPRYTQEWDLSECCSDGYSGCGATAWAMFYGYWDHQGVNNLIAGSGGTPWSNNDAVRSCIRSVFDSIDTWCTGIGGAAATNPWDMGYGYEWANARDEGITLSWSWTVPYTSFGSRNRARASIRDHAHPAIVGTGYFEHYPLAYGYRSRNFTWLGITWQTDRQWKVNNGWGSGACSWVNAAGCFFGTDGHCY